MISKETRRDRVDWIQMAQDRNHRWTLVTTAPAGRQESPSCSDVTFLNWYTWKVAVVTLRTRRLDVSPSSADRLYSTLDAKTPLRSTCPLCTLSVTFKHLAS